MYVLILPGKLFVFYEAFKFSLQFWYDFNLNSIMIGKGFIKTDGS